MSHKILIAALLGAAGLGLGITTFNAAHSQPAGTHPLKVVELFQSEGCSDCPPAEANLNAISGRPDVLALSFEVTYWNQLGWTDRYSKPAFTARQWDYAHAAGRGDVYTPQMVVNGRNAFVGASRAQVEAQLNQAQATPNAPVISATKAAATITAARAVPHAQVWLVTYDPRTINVPVRAGENAGRTLPHRNIVVGIEALGSLKSGTSTFALHPHEGNLAQAILVQDGSGGAILSAAKIS